jgi:polysaccharide export outer membrane protein
MKGLFSILALALFGFVPGFEARAADPPPIPRDPIVDPTKPLPPAINDESPSSSTRLPVPAGTDIKITIEVLGKPKPPPLPLPEGAESAAPKVPSTTSPPASRNPQASRIPRGDPIWDLARIKPEPLPIIPHDPPPHEGAMFGLPYVAAPPDMLRVEVHETLPGRPLKGEYLVRSDGMITLGFYGDLYVRGLTLAQIKHKLVVHLRRFLDDEKLGLVAQDGKGEWQDVKPQDSDKVLVDLHANHSKYSFIQGDVNAPGKFAWTADETVLDGLNHAKGFLKTADPKNIRLVRPSRDGQPARVYKVDYQAILERGERAENYQLFPGDRLIVGRNPVIESTLEIDRMAAPVQTAFNTMLQQSFAVRGLTQSVFGDPASATPEEREALVKEWADFWWKVVQRPPGADLDEATFREALMRTLAPPQVKKPGKTK